MKRCVFSDVGDEANPEVTQHPGRTGNGPVCRGGGSGSLYDAVLVFIAAATEEF